MDVMACSVSRSGNYRGEPAPVQVVFPEREFFVLLSASLDGISRTGNYFGVEPVLS